MPLSRTPLGARLAALGAALLLGALWLPWYRISMPQAFRDALRSLGGGDTAPAGAPQAQGIGGAMNALVSGLASAMPESISANGWQAMKGGDIALAVIAGLVMVLVTRGLGALRIDDEARSQGIAGLGLAAVAIVGYHVVRKPFGDLPGFIDAPSLRFGLAVALAGAVLIGVGGHLLAKGSEPEAVIDASELVAVEPESDADVAPAYVPPAAGTSVAPPGLG